MHKHIKCEHTLEYCQICDVVYCSVCGKEWNSFTVTVSSPWQITYSHEHGTPGINPDIAKLISR